MSTSILWFKRDLRLYDHRALAEAMQRSETVIPVYLREPSVRARPDFGDRHVTFIEECLFELQAELRAAGSDLLILDMEAISAFERIYRRVSFSAIYAHEETGNGATFERDKAVARWCRAQGIAFHEYNQNGVQRGLKDRDGWSRGWTQRMYTEIVDFPENFARFPELLKPHCAVPKPGERRPKHQQGGRQGAVNTLESFLLERGRAYHKQMSSPLSAETACSRLSSHLAYGSISMREVVQVTEGRKMALKESGVKGFPLRALNSFLSRCHWHCHFMQKLEREPKIETHCFNVACESLREQGTRSEYLERWKSGQTGYPFFDACMRYLDANGWINFRMRAMITSFAAYNLWIDWRDFKDWLACQFQDYEPGIHISQVQMQSGVTGINTLRIYNVVKQGFDQDPQGIFIRRWVPELSGYPDEYIHEPWKVSVSDQRKYGAELNKKYPLPVVDLAQSAKEARAHFTELRRDPLYWNDSERVKEVHGSRKSTEARPRKPKKAARDNQMELKL